MSTTTTFIQQPTATDEALTLYHFARANWSFLKTVETKLGVRKFYQLNSGAPNERPTAEVISEVRPDGSVFFGVTLKTKQKEVDSVSGLTAYKPASFSISVVLPDQLAASADVAKTLLSALSILTKDAGMSAASTTAIDGLMGGNAIIST